MTAHNRRAVRQGAAVAVLALAMLVTILALQARGDSAPLWTASIPDVVQPTVAPAWAHEQEPDQACTLTASDPTCVATSNGFAGPAPGQGWQRQNRLTLHSLPAGALTDPNRPSGAVLDARLEPGDINNVSGNQGHRSQVYDRFPSTPASSTPASAWPDPPGQTRLYKISVWLDPLTVFEPDTSVNWGGPIFAQIKGYRGGSPTRSLQLRTYKWYSDSSIAGRYYLGNATRGVWTRFEFLETLSLDKTIGGVQIKRDGAVVVPWTHLPTLETVTGKIDPVYLTAGPYESAGRQKSDHVQIGDVSVTAATPPA